MIRPGRLDTPAAPWRVALPLGAIALGLVVSSPAMAAAGLPPPAFLAESASFLTRPEVSAFLLTMGFLGILVEFVTLHLVAGVIGMACLALFFVGHIEAGLSPWSVTLLFLVGVLLVAVEAFLVRGHGVSGVVGACAILGSVYLTVGDPVQAMRQMSLSLAVAVGVFLLLLRHLPRSRVLEHLALTTVQDVKQGYVSGTEEKGLVGVSGIAQSDLRPAGIAHIADRRHGVVTEGEYVPSGSRIEVLRVEGSKIVVRRIADAPKEG